MTCSISSGSQHRSTVDVRNGCETVLISRMSDQTSSAGRYPDQGPRPEGFAVSLTASSGPSVVFPVAACFHPMHTGGSPLSTAHLPTLTDPEAARGQPDLTCLVSRHLLTPPPARLENVLSQPATGQALDMTLVETRIGPQEATTMRGSAGPISPGQAQCCTLN